jgi:hypothetical protein
MEVRIIRISCMKGFTETFKPGAMGKSEMPPFITLCARSCTGIFHIHIGGRRILVSFLGTHSTGRTTRQNSPRFEEAL